MFFALLKWLLTFVCLSLLLTWALLNRDSVPFDFSPMHDPVNWPLFAPMMLAAAIGFLWGAGIAWINAAGTRKHLRQIKKSYASLAPLSDGENE